MTKAVLLLVLLLVSAVLARHWIVEEYDEEADSEEPTPDKDNACWKQTYGRGVGVPLSTCRSGEERNGALCYPNCAGGFNGVGPVCWQSGCPSGFRDDGAYCAKPAAYGRGAGYAIWDQGKCNREHNQGCEKDLAMWYPKCREGFRKVGCCICSPSCPSGMEDIGVSCAKKSYGRGAGKPMVCGHNMQEDAALCYNHCKASYQGVGPVCWQACPKSKPFACGAMCTSDSSVCTEKVLKMVTSIVKTVAKAVSKDPEALVDAMEAATEFVLPLCPDH